MSSKERKRYYRKKTELFLLLEKMKLWPSRTGILHGIREIRRQGEYAIITTHCGQTFRIRNSRNCRNGSWKNTRKPFSVLLTAAHWKIRRSRNDVF